MAKRTPPSFKEGFNIHKKPGSKRTYLSLVRRGNVYADLSYTRAADCRRAVTSMLKWFRSGVPIHIHSRRG